jgi:tetratricopeptide (TPR) repeat protein
LNRDHTFGTYPRLISGVTQLLSSRIGRAHALLLLLLSCLAGFACQGTEAKKATHLARGEQYAKDGRHGEAIIEFKNVLQLDPNAAGAHWDLAQSYLATKKIREGYWELHEAARLDPKNLDAKLQYGDLSRLGGETEEALKQADEVIAADPNRWAAYVLRGQALEILRHPEDAKEAYLKAVEVAPSDSSPLLVLSDYYVRTGDAKSAEPLLRKLTESQPSFGSFGALGGFLSRDKSRDAEAEATFKEALAKAKPEELSVAYRMLGSFYYSRDRFDDAERTLKEGLEKVPGDLEIIYGLARFYAARGDNAKADAMVEEATKAKPTDVAPYLTLSAYRGRKNDLQGALDAVNSALKVAPDNTQARLRKAELLLDLGYRNANKEQIAEARSIVDAILIKSANSPEGLFVKAKMDLAEGHLPDAAAGLRRAVEIRPDWAQAHYLLATVLNSEGDHNSARAEASRALEIDADLLDARRLLASNQAALGADDLAVEEGRKVLREAPDDLKIRILVAQSLVRQGKLDEALAELEKIPEAKRDAETYYAFGRIYMGMGKLDSARANLLRADAALPNQPDVLNSLLLIDKQTGHVRDSLERILRAAGAQPANVRLEYLLGITLELSGKTSDAEQVFKNTIELDPGYVAPYQALSVLLASSGRRAEGIETYKKAIEARPDVAGLHLVLGTLYEGGGDTQHAMEEYDKAVKLDPNLAVAKNNLAYLLAEQGQDLIRALDLAQEAKAGLPDSASAADTLGWVLYKKGVPSAAVGYLREAEGGSQAEDPSINVIRLHLAMAYEANGEPDKARETLERAVASLDAARSKAPTGAPEPPQAAEVRSMMERLKTQAAAGPGQG